MNDISKIIFAGLIGLFVGMGCAAFYFWNMAHSPVSVTHPQSLVQSPQRSMEEQNHSSLAGFQGKTGDAFDSVFIKEMIVHHEGAIEMAQLALQNANHQEIKSLSRDIINAQAKEIALMKKWQASWFGATTTVDTATSSGEGSATGHHAE